MKKIMQWVMAATLMCGATAFSSCSNDDDGDSVSNNLGAKIVGKWMTADIDGKVALTNEKEVITFVSPTKAYISKSYLSTLNTDKGSQSSGSSVSKRSNSGWRNYDECDVKIVGDTVTLTSNGASGILVFKSISESEFVCEVIRQTSSDGQSTSDDFLTQRRYERVTNDYKKTIIGLWECEGISGGETFNDANGRLEFRADGTYNFYRQNDSGDWEFVTTREFQYYFVDGTLVATRWKDQGEDEEREWWEIASLSGNQMLWTALRRNADGSTFRQEVKWRKIDLNVAEKIIGKWMVADMNGHPLPTNQKSVYTFVSSTKAYMSASLNWRQDVEPKWIEYEEYDVTIDCDKLVLKHQRDVHTTVAHVFNVTAISDTDLMSYLKVALMVDRTVDASSEDPYHFSKVNADYKEAVLGLWECTELTGMETFNNANARLEFFADGTYKYWRKDDGGEWQTVTSREFQYYFVDGTLLATRWKNVGDAELREWWEIASIANGQMQWTALRQNADGTTVQQGMKWKKVE